MKSLVFASFYFLFAITICQAQKDPISKNNALSFELGKSGLVYNLNFDHKFHDKKIGFRVDIGSFFSKYLNSITTGGGFYYLFGQKINFFETGIDLNYLGVTKRSDDQLGVPLFYPNYPVKTYYASVNFGYRKYGQKTLFRIGISPGIIKNNFIPGAYVSFGLTF